MRGPIGSMGIWSWCGAWLLLLSGRAAGRLGWDWIGSEGILILHSSNSKDAVSE